MDSSDISAVDSFTQTQYSRWSKLGGKSKIFPKIKADSIEDDHSPFINNKRLFPENNDESLSLTPSSNDKWMLSQKSLNNNKAPNNRTVE